MDLFDYNFTEEEEAKIVTKQFENAFSIFQKEAIIDGEPVMCQFHETFETYDTKHHNCLGCNFADSTLMINNFLQTYKFQGSIQSAYSTFIVLAYLLVERIDTLFNIIELNNDYRTEHFKILLEIRRWANFLKHPKAFLLTHHPTYSFHSSPKNKDLIENAKVIIDRNFVNEFYANDDRNEDLNNKLENQENVLVIFPNIPRITEDLCKAMRDCVAIARDNEVYRQVLEDKTTFYDYWINFQEIED
jgi:hypothetical protein